jgi:hypothetical protein
MSRTERAVIVWKPQPRQLEFMRRPEPEALYGGAAGGAHRCGRISQSADAGAAGQRKIHDRKADSDDHASDV